MRYRFDDCELRLDTHELIVSDRPVAVEPQVFALIRHLVERPQQLVTQDDLCEAVWNGRIVSDSAISARISAARAALGDSGAKQHIIKTVPRRGFRFVVPVKEIASSKTSATRSAAAEPDKRQTVRFCNSRDGCRIAYAKSGSGLPLLRAGHWLTHLEHDWQSPLWQPFLGELGKSFELTRYDQRGNGLSDWEIKEFSLESCLNDLETVADAADLERFALYGTSQGAPIAIAYAARYPERVSHLILHGGFVRGRLIRSSAVEREQGEAIQTLIRHSWGKPGSPFIHAFAAMFIPDATADQLSSLTELQRLTTSPENALMIRNGVDRFDVADLLDRISAPTLVMHARNDGVQPLDQGRALAAGISNAEFTMLESANHVILPHEPAWPVLFDELHRFLLT